MGLTQFRAKKGIEIVDGSTSIFYGKGVPTSSNPQATAKLSANDLYIDSETQKLYKFNGATWVLSGSFNRLGDGNFANNNYITDVDDNGTNTFTKAISDLDAITKVNADQISSLVSGTNPRGFAFAITGDSTNFGNGVAGPVPVATVPSDSNQGSWSPQNGDALFHVDGTRWIYSSGSSTWVKDTVSVNAVKDLWAIGLDLTNPAGQELQALYVFTATGFVKFGEVSNDIASAIGISAGYTAGVGTVSSSDTVQSALQKLDGNIGSRNTTNQYNVTNAEALTSQIDDLDNAIGERSYAQQYEVTDGESVALSIDALDQAIGDRSNYSSTPKVISNGDSLAAAIGKLDQASGFAVNVVSALGSITAAYNRQNANNGIAIKWYITVIETPTSGKGAVYASEIIAVYQGAGSSDSDVDSTEYGVVEIGTFDSGPSLTFGFSGVAVNIGVTAAKSGSTVHISVKGTILGEFTNNV